jgi:hypothetical protein
MIRAQFPSAGAGMQLRSFAVLVLWLGAMVVAACSSDNGSQGGDKDALETAVGTETEAETVTETTAEAAVETAPEIGTEPEPEVVVEVEPEATGPAGHSEDNGGVMHKPGKNDPLDNCTQCHGAQLKGGAGPSCYTCHDNSDHTKSHGGHKHLSGSSSTCKACHGPNNDGGLGPACSTCH